MCVVSVHVWAQSVVSFQRRWSTTKPVVRVVAEPSGTGNSLSLCSLNAGDHLLHQNAPESLHADAQQRCRSPEHKAHITKLHNKKQRMRERHIGVVVEKPDSCKGAKTAQVLKGKRKTARRPKSEHSRALLLDFFSPLSTPPGASLEKQPRVEHDRVTARQSSVQSMARTTSAAERPLPTRPLSP